MPGRTRNRQQRPALLICLLLIFSVFTCQLSAEQAESPAGKLRISFSAAVEQSLRQSAAALDKATISLFSALDKKDNINIKVHSHFYDSRIRRYFVSTSGNVVFQGKLPWKFEHSNYLISGNREVSFDISINDIKKSRDAITFNFEATFVVSMDRLAYRMIQTIPHFAASGALGPAFDMLGEFFAKLNIGILSEAISDTVRSFSTVAFTKASTELISQAGKNKNLGKVIHDSVKDGSILSYLGITILKTATTSIVSVSGATLGSMVGSVIAPGAGTAIGAFLGSQILTLVSKAIIYELTAEIPLKINIKRMVNNWRILQNFPSDEKARETFESLRTRTEKKIAAELGSEKFSLFKSLLEEVDEMDAENRPALVPLLKGIQQTLSFKITNEGDWYYARQYYQLKAAVDKWGLQKQIVFTTVDKPESSDR